MNKTQPQVEPDVEAAEGRAENLEEGMVPMCNVVMVIQPGPTGVWAAERDDGGGGEDGGEEELEAEGEGAERIDSVCFDLTFDQLLERIAIGFRASCIHPPPIQFEPPVGVVHLGVMDPSADSSVRSGVLGNSGRSLLLGGEVGHARAHAMVGTLHTSRCVCVCVCVCVFVFVFCVSISVSVSVSVSVCVCLHASARECTRAHTSRAHACLCAGRGSSGGKYIVSPTNADRHSFARSHTHSNTLIALTLTLTHTLTHNTEILP